MLLTVTRRKERVKDKKKERARRTEPEAGPDMDDQF